MKKNYRVEIDELSLNTLKAIAKSLSNVLLEMAAGKPLTQSELDALKGNSFCLNKYTSSLDGMAYLNYVKNAA